MDGTMVSVMAENLDDDEFVFYQINRMTCVHITETFLHLLVLLPVVCLMMNVIESGEYAVRFGWLIGILCIKTVINGLYSPT
jgi:ABC-type transport system involved in cytochrome c biogenesis permease component